jgi:ABC-type transporter Mla MlaB component
MAKTESSDQPPAVLDVDVEGDRVLVAVDRGELSLVVEAPREIEAADLEALLTDVPEKVETVAELFSGGPDA